MKHPVDDPLVIMEALRCVRLLKDSYELPLRPNILVRDGTLFITIKGTDSFRDMLTDVNVYLVKFEGTHYRAHSGFVDDYQLARETVLDAVAAASTRVVVTGHSLGGAVATLLAVAIREHHPTLPLSVYTFGSPKVCCRPLAKHHNRIVATTYRFVNDRDLVPRVPAWGFTHVAGLVHLLQSGQRASAPRRWWAKLREWCTTQFTGIGEHYLIHYQDALEARLGRLACDQMWPPPPSARPPGPFTY